MTNATESDLWIITREDQTKGVDLYWTGEDGGWSADISQARRVTPIVPGNAAAFAALRRLVGPCPLNQPAKIACLDAAYGTVDVSDSSRDARMSL